MNRASRLRFAAVLPLVLAAIVAIALFVENWNFYEDDAFITLRYCRNWLNGDGIVWNPGERVEGYSNFLYLAFVGLLGALHVELRTASRIVGIAAYVGIALLAYGYGAEERRRGEAARANVPVIVVLASGPIVVWSLGGLEGTLCGFFAVCGVSLVARYAEKSDDVWPFALAGLFFSLATMTRLDAALFPVALTIALLLIRGWRRALRPLLAQACGFAVAYVPYFAWRFHYYGDFFPNTVYAKGTSTDFHTLVSGVRYVVGFLVRPPFLGLWIAAVAALGIRRSRFPASFVCVAAAALGYLVFPVIAGGDHMVASRFVVPVIPVLALLLFESMVAADFAGANANGLHVGVALVLCTALQFPSRQLNPIHADPAAFLGEVIGDYAETHWPRGALVAVNAAGAVPYAARDLRFVDMLGLNDRRIAHAPTRHSGLPRADLPGHRKGDGDYVLSRHPDYIILGPPEGTPVDKPWWVSDWDISNKRIEFERHYERQDVDVDATRFAEYRHFQASETGKIHFIFYHRI